MRELFHFRELLLRLQSAISMLPPKVLACPAGELNLRSGEITNEGVVQVSLAARDLSLLKLLYKRQPDIVSRDEILDQCKSISIAHGRCGKI